MEQSEPRKILDEGFRKRLLTENEVKEDGILYRRAIGNTGASYVACDQRSIAVAMYGDQGERVFPSSTTH